MADKSVFMLVYACLLAGCGVSGPPVGAPYRPVDMHADLGKIDGNTVLAGPAGWTPAPSITTPVFKAAAPELFAAMREIMQGQPRTWLMGSSPEQNQASFIVRSLVMNFPDVVVVQAVAATPSTSKAVIFSQSRYDIFPVLDNTNKDRVEALIGRLKDRFEVIPAPAKT